jgi:hypothetical protein
MTVGGLASVAPMRRDHRNQLILSDKCCFRSSASSGSLYVFVSERGGPTRALQHYLGHKNIQHTVRYTEMAPDRFKDFWRGY